MPCSERWIPRAGLAVAQLCPAAPKAQLISSLPGVILSLWHSWNGKGTQQHLEQLQRRWGRLCHGSEQLGRIIHFPSVFTYHKIRNEELCRGGKQNKALHLFGTSWRVQSCPDLLLQHQGFPSDACETILTICHSICCIMNPRQGSGWFWGAVNHQVRSNPFSFSDFQHLPLKSAVPD